MDDAIRTQMIAHLDELRALLKARGAEGASRDANASAHEQHNDAALLSHIADLQALVAGDASDLDKARTAAQGLEERVLAWEAEHPQLTALASRIARALEVAGL